MAKTVLVVPGLLGSELYANVALTAFLPTNRVWVDNRGLLAGRWHWLELGADGTAPVNGYPQLRPGFPLPFYYCTLSDYLRTQGYSVHSPQFDWRGTVQNDAFRLANLIRALQYEEEPMAIVAHSRGGVVVRQALGLLQPDEPANGIECIIGLGVPHTGSLSPARVLGGWDADKLKLYLLLEVIAGVLQGGYPKHELNRILSTMPSWYELLPFSGNSWCPPLSRLIAVTPETYTSAGLPCSTPWMTHALAWQAQQEPYPANIDWYDFVGLGVLTPGSIVRNSVISDPGCMQYTTEGDGYVHRGSATHSGGVVITTPTGHGMMIQDGRVFDMIRRILLGQISVPQTIPGPVLAGDAA